MTDQRIETLARNLLGYSLEIKAGDRIFIEGETGSEPLVRGLLEEAYRMGAVPSFEVIDPKLRRTWLFGATREQMDQKVANDMHRLEGHDAHLYILAGDNASELADVPAETMQSWSLSRQLYIDAVEKKRWCVLRFPTSSAAQAAGMSTEAFEEFCFRVSCLDYAKMDKAMDPLVELMQKTDQVHIVGPGTDLTFSIKGMPANKCAGKLNVPDGEVFTAPIRDSANGTITYNAPFPVDGVTFENVSLTFEQGRIVSATGTPQDKLIKRLDTDEGARYLGEFSFGVNPSITFPMKDILYDEKIAGSVHLTPGNAYEDYSDNGNRSAVHWDLVLIQTAECGLDWFFNGGSLDETDVRTGAEENRLVVEVEFSGITELDRERLGKYAIPGNDTLSIWKSWEDRREKLYGRGRACPDFLEIRAGSTATDRRRLYNDLRTTNPAFDDLPTVTSDAQVQAQLDQWEASHPEQLQDVDIDSTTHLFGFAGQAVMSGLFDYVMVTADLRAGEQTQDARGAILGRILEQAVDRSGADTDLALLAERTRTEQ